MKKLIGDWKKDLGGELQDWEVRETAEVAVGTLTHGRALSQRNYPHWVCNLTFGRFSSVLLITVGPVSQQTGRIVEFKALYTKGSGRQRWDLAVGLRRALGRWASRIDSLALLPSLLCALLGCSLSSTPQDGVLRGKEKIKNTPTIKIRFTKEEMRQVENVEKYLTSLEIKGTQIKTMDYFLETYQISKNIQSDNA